MKSILAAALLALAVQGDDADAIRDRLDKYLFEYEPQLSALVAEERMQQRDGLSSQANRMTAQPVLNRRLISEVAFIALPGDAGWLGFRRVTNLNGKAVKDQGTPLATLLSDGGSDDYDQARLLLSDSAQHNLGLPRTTNLPNLPLEFLHPRNRHRLNHRVDGIEKVNGLATTRMVFQEHSTPTIIQRPEGGDMQSLVTAWIETATGRLIRAEVKTRDPRIGTQGQDNIIRVDFRPDAKLAAGADEMKEEFSRGSAKAPARRATPTTGSSRPRASSRRRSHEAIAAVALTALIAAPQPTAQATRTQLNAYRTEYETKLSERIADERLLQRDVPRQEGRPGSEAFLKRSLQSEVAFIALPGDAGWLGFRRVLQLDAKPVEDSLGSLNAVLFSGPQDDYAKARLMLTDSARFNLGTPRTINLPNLPLEVLHPRHAGRFTMRIAGSEQIAGHHTIKLVLVENVTPTIIRAFDGSQMRSIVSAFVEPETGRLWRADVITRDPRPARVVFDHVVSVTFQENRELGLLVPAKMREDSLRGPRSKAWGDADLRNYRRFQTSARIVPQ